MGCGCQGAFDEPLAPARVSGASSGGCDRPDEARCSADPTGRGACASAPGRVTTRCGGPYEELLRLHPWLRETLAFPPQAVVEGHCGRTAAPPAPRARHSRLPACYRELARLQPWLGAWLDRTLPEAHRPRRRSRPGRLRGAPDGPYAELLRLQPWLRSHLAGHGAGFPADQPLRVGEPKPPPTSGGAGTGVPWPTSVEGAIAALDGTIRRLHAPSKAGPEAEQEQREAQLQILFSRCMPPGPRLAAYFALTDPSSLAAGEVKETARPRARGVLLKGAGTDERAVRPASFPFDLLLGAPTAATCTRGLGTVGDPEEAFSGVCYWRFNVIRPAGDPQTLFQDRRRKQGTPEQLLRDAERLGVTHLRQVGDGDTYYDTLWVGCADYSGGLHGEDNVWYALPTDFPGTGHGWFCSPSSGDLETVWDLGAPCGAIVVAPVCPTEGPVLEEDEGGGPFTLLCG